jgi:hypothetical protein
MEFQHAWSLWLPSVYRPIAITPNQVVDDYIGPSPDNAIAGFSGGVDSVFTVLRHATQQLGELSYPLRDRVLMVHGFDVPLHKPTDFEALKSRVVPLLNSLSLRLNTVRTNLKELALQNWEDSFAAQLASCLHNFSHESRYGLIASSEPYSDLVLPWGSNPCTDHLLSGCDMQTVHDGAGYSRTEKVALIATNPTAASVLKVCWVGEDTHRNCGECEKCIRTQLNFLAVGCSNPPCFDAPLRIEGIWKIRPVNAAQRKELESIVSYAKARNISGEWLAALENTLATAKPPSASAARLMGLTRRWQRFWLVIRRGDFAEAARKIRRQLHFTARN